MDPKDIIEVKAKKISSENVEVLDADGVHVTGKEEPIQFKTGGIRVVNMGPLGLLLLPLMIPLFILGFLLLAFFAMLFGRAFFRAGMSKFFRKF